MSHVTKYTNSLRNYAIAVASAHVVALCWLFPHVIMFIVVPPAIFYLLFLWCELVYEIDVVHRQKLLKKIREADNDLTREVLTWELILHEEHSFFTMNTNDRLGL